MNRLKTLASGSSGNAYVLTAGKDALVLEAGVKDKELLKCLNWEVNNVAGVIVSHRAT